MNEIRIIGISRIPEIKPKDDLGEIIVSAIFDQKVKIEDGDIIVVTSKIVSKAEGRIIDLRKINPSSFSNSIGRKWMKDPRLVEAILSETERVVRMDGGIIIVETKHGFICANAGIDQSNMGENLAALLPLNPDLSAKRIREAVKRLTKVDVAVIITDTFGRPWREGQVNVAIGVSGIKPIKDYRGAKDPYGYELKVTMMAIADELASVSELIMGKLNRIPVTVIKGFSYTRSDGSVRELLRRPRKDLFR